MITWSKDKKVKEIPNVEVVSPYLKYSLKKSKSILYLIPSTPMPNILLLRSTFIRIYDPLVTPTLKSINQGFPIIQIILLDQETPQIYPKWNELEVLIISKHHDIPKSSLRSLQYYVDTGKIVHEHCVDIIVMKKIHNIGHEVVMLKLLAM